MPWSELGDRSSPYRLVWLVTVAVLTAVGLAAAFVLASVVTNLLVFLLAFGVIAAVQISLRSAQEDLDSRSLGGVFHSSGLAAVVVVAITGYAIVAGPATIPLVLVVALTSPPMLARLTGTPTDRPAQPIHSDPPEDPAPAPRPVDAQPAPVVEVPEPPTPAVSELSDEDLCLAWRRSFTALEHARTPQERLAVANARLAYLDELERRHPDAFAQWFGTNPRAAADPTRYFLRTSDRRRPD